MLPLLATRYRLTSDSPIESLLLDVEIDSEIVSDLFAIYIAVKLTSSARVVGSPHCMLSAWVFRTLLPISLIQVIGAGGIGLGSCLSQQRYQRKSRLPELPEEAEKNPYGDLKSVADDLNCIQLKVM